MPPPAPPTHTYVDVSCNPPCIIKAGARFYSDRVFLFCACFFHFERACFYFDLAFPFPFVSPKCTMEQTSKSLSLALAVRCG